MLNRGSLGAGEIAIELVQQSAVGRRQQFPGDRAEKRRRHEGSRHQRADGLPSRHVGARHQPADRRGDQAADHGRGGGDDRGRQQRIEEVGVGEQRDEILQRRMPCLVRERKDRQPRHRQHDQHDQKAANSHSTGARPVDAGLGVSVGGGGDAVMRILFRVIPGRCGSIEPRNLEFDAQCARGLVLRTIPE